MKRILKTSLFAFMIAASVASCSKDDKSDTKEPAKNNPTAEQKMVGKWDMDGFDQDGDAKSSGTTIYTYVMTGSNFSGSFNFNADLTYTNDTKYDVEMVMDIPGIGKQTVNNSIDINDSGTWKVNADGDLEITSSQNNTTQVLEIATLSDSKLVLTGVVSDTQTQGGQTATVTGNSVLSFKK